MTPVTNRHEPFHHGLVAVDIEGSGRADRTDRVRADLQDALPGLLRDAVCRIGVEKSAYVYLERGDGAALVFDATVPESHLVDDLVRVLRGELRHLASMASEAARMRLRIAVHAGKVIAGTTQSGTDLNHAFALLDSDELRAALAASPGLYALCVSDPVFQSVVRHGYGLLDPDEFREIRIGDEESSAAAWLWTGCARPLANPPLPPPRGREQRVQHVSGNARAIQDSWGPANLGDIIQASSAGPGATDPRSST